MLPLTVAANALPREALTEEFVSEVVLGVVREVVPGAKDDRSLAVDATAREDHFRVAVSTRLYGVYEGLETWGATISTRLYEGGIPTLIYPEVALVALSDPLADLPPFGRGGIVRIAIPIPPAFERLDDGSIARRSPQGAQESTLEAVRAFASSARLAPDEANSSKNEAHIELSLDDYRHSATALPVHLLDPD